MPVTKQDIVSAVVTGHLENAMRRFKAHPDLKNATELKRAQLAVKRIERTDATALYDRLPPAQWVERLTA